MARTPIVVGNWKMYKTPREAQTFARELTNKLGRVRGVEIGVAPTYAALWPVGQRLAETNVALCAQNVYWEVQGAFTGEVSAPMLKDAGVTYVIVGHSERRQYFGETDATVNKRLHAALGEGLGVIACIGETLAEREAGKTLAIVKRQLDEGLQDVGGTYVAKLVVAYEPVWAIGTGKVATVAQIAEVHAQIRGWLTARFGDAGQGVRIQYGGSVKPGNAAEIFAVPDVDGALVGGASLVVDDFCAIVQAAARG